MIRESRRQYLPYPSPQGSGNMRGYLVRPAGARQMARRCCDSRKPRPQSVHRGRRAASGHREFHGVRAGRPHPRRRISRRRREGGPRCFRDSTPQGAPRTSSPRRWLKIRPESTGKLGAIGFCFGGGILNSSRCGCPISRPAFRSTAGSPVLRKPEDQGASAAPLRGIDGASRGWPAFDAALKARHQVPGLHVPRPPTTASSTTRRRATTKPLPNWPGHARSRS